LKIVQNQNSVYIVYRLHIYLRKKPTSSKKNNVVTKTWYWNPMTINDKSHFIKHVFIRWQIANNDARSIHYTHEDYYHTL